MKNIFYIHTHDMGRFNSLYGYAIKTPNMEDLAKDSTLFRNAHCACPTCSPSRGALLTGMMPHENGLMGLAHRHSFLERNDAHLANFLKDKGYTTALAGIQHEVYNNVETIKEKLGYDYINIDNPYDQNAAEFINNYSDEKPLFMSVGFWVTHRPYIKHDDSINPDYLAVPSCIPDTKETREDYADYIASCQQLDKEIGVVVSAIKDKGLYDDSIIIFTTDHGIAFPFMKCHLYDYGTGVTLAIKQAKGKKFIPMTDALVSHIDVYPTICDMLNIEKPDYLRGKSLMTALTGDDENINDHIFTEITFHAAYEPIRSVRTNKYKLIRHYDADHMSAVLPNMDKGASKLKLMDCNLKNKAKYPEELYDLMLDPQERNNIISNPKYANVKNKLTKLLEDEIIKTNDPIISGKIPSGMMDLNFRCDDHPTNEGRNETIV